MCKISDCAEHMHYHKYTVKTVPVGWRLNALCSNEYWPQKAGQSLENENDITDFHINLDNCGGLITKLDP